MDIPQGTYIHTETDDIVKYVTRDDEAYHFSINDGERTLKIPTEEWEDYQEFLEEY